MCYHVAIACVVKRRGPGRAHHTLINFAIAMGVLIGIVLVLGAISMIMEHYRQFHQANFSRLQTGIPVGIAGIILLVTILEVAVLFPEVCKLWQQRQVEVLYRSKVAGPPEEDQPLDLPDSLLEEAEMRSALETKEDMEKRAAETGEELSGAENL
jgi:hypothetical protein